MLNIGMEDPELLTAYLENDSEEAFATLVDRYTGLVYAAALRQAGGNATLARDVAQSVFTDLARKASTLRSRATLTGWLYTSTHYAVVQALRTESRRRAREQEAQAMMEISSDSPTHSCERLKAVLDEAMRELNEPDREAVLLRYFAGQPYSKIGDMLSVPENTARMRVDRALDKLHALLSRRGITSTAGAIAALLPEAANAATPSGLAAELAHAALSAVPVAKGVLSAAGAAKVQAATLGAVLMICAGGLILQMRANDRLHADTSLRRQQNERAAALLRGEQMQLERRLAQLSTQERFAAAIAHVPVVRSGDLANAERRRLALQTRATLAKRYAGLFRMLRLPDNKQRRMEELLLEKTLNEIAGLHNLSYGAPDVAISVDLGTIRLLKAALGAGTEEQIHTLLGDADFARYRTYERTIPIRRQMEEVAAAMRLTDVKLSDDQITGLIAVVSQADPDFTLPLTDAFLHTAAIANLDDAQRTALLRLQALRCARRTILETNRDAAKQGLVHLDPPTGTALSSL